MLGISRAEHGSAPTDHRLKNLCTVSGWHCKNLDAVVDKRRKNLGVSGVSGVNKWVGELCFRAEFFFNS